jgi:hypothetical protein
MAKFDPKAKAKRQKIILAVLGVVLVGVLVFQGPKIMSMFGGGSSTAASEPASPTPTPVTPAPTPTPGVVTPAGGTAELVDSDPVAVATDGQLVSFDRFESKDPFAQQGGEILPNSTSAPSVPADPTAKGDDPEGDGGRPAPEPANTAPKQATISVNGSPHDVLSGGTFPEGDPIFKLVSVTRNSAKVGIVGGTYSTGSQTVTLKQGGKPVTLMNTADGTTYVLRLVRAG